LLHQITLIVEPGHCCARLHFSKWIWHEPWSKTVALLSNKWGGNEQTLSSQCKSQVDSEKSEGRNRSQRTNTSKFEIQKRQYNIHGWSDFLLTSQTAIFLCVEIKKIVGRGRWRSLVRSNESCTEENISLLVRSNHYNSRQLVCALKVWFLLLLAMLFPVFNT
jgi:hypothetical protein